MRTMCKRILAVLSAMLMLITVMSPMVYAAPDSYNILVMDTDTNVTIAEAGEKVYFQFIPTESGRYVFTSNADMDTYGYLYNEDMETLKSDDDGGSGSNFQIVYSLVAGTTYYYGVRYYNESNTGSFTVRLSEQPTVVDIAVDPISCIENWDGSMSSYWDYDTDEYIEYFHYSWSGKLSYTVTFNDGQVCTGSGTGFSDNNGNWYDVDYDDDQTGNTPWTVGNTYDATMSVLDYEVTVPVTITESPVESIVVDPVSCIVNCDGSEYSYWDDNDNEIKYYHYSWWNKLSYTITMKDGTVYTGSGTGFYDNDDNWYSIHRNDDQSGSSPWTVGNTYNPTISLLGYTTTVPVTITESPVESIVIDPVSCIVNYDGYVSSYWDDEDQIDKEYFRYDWWNKLSYTITMKDGTVYTGNGSNFSDDNGNWYYINYSDGQNGNSPWTVGKTYKPTISVLGYTTTVSVTITESPVKNMVIDPVSCIVNCDGYKSSYWDDEEQIDKEYFRYDWWNRLSFTITMKDGTVYTGSGNGFSDNNGNWYSVNHDDNQGDNGSWTVGKTYKPTVSLLGYTTTVPVTITESPVKSVSLKPISIIENDGGYMESYWDDDDNQVKYYHYYWWEELSYTVTMKDGTVYTGTGNGFYDKNDHWYGFNCNDDQHGNNPWTVGNTYKPTISILGYTTTVSVTITESPVQSIEVKPISMIENMGGYMSSYWDYVDGEEIEIEYYRYYWWDRLSYTITMKDGTVYTGTGSGFYDDEDNWYGFSRNDEQWGNSPWTVGNTYNPTISIWGYTTIVPVTITDAPVASITATPIYLDSKRDSYQSDSWSDELGQWVWYTVYDWRDYLAITVTMKDGTVCPVKGSYFEYDGVSYEIDYTFSQNLNNQWSVGNTYTETITLLGVSTDVSITVMEPKVVDGIKYLEQADSIIISGTTDSGDTLTIPDTINDKPVVAITSLYGGNYEEIIIPDSVTTLSGDALDNCWALEKITIGAGVQTITNDMLSGAWYLSQVTVSEDNENYTSVDGIVYDKAVTTMVAIPAAKTSTHTVPATATDIELYINNTYSFDIVLQNGASGYMVEDGVMYNADKTVIVSCASNKTGDYVMPDSVHTIRPLAFCGSDLESVKVSANVTEIVYYTFSGCDNLKKVELPDTLTTIGFNAFSGCDSLTSIKLPQSLTTLEEAAFASSGLTSITIPGSLEYIGSSAFAYSDLKTLTISKGVKEIGSSAFYDTNLTSVTLPSSVHTVDSSAFCHTPLKTVNLGSVQYIYSSAFSNTKLTSISFPKTLKYIGSYAFSDSNLSKLTVPANVTLGEGVFSGCPIKSLTLSDGITSTGAYTFYDIDITSLKLPKSVTDIAYYSFASCSKLANIDLPDNLQSLCGHAFDDTAWLKNQPDGVVYLDQALYGYKGTMSAKTSVRVKDGTTLIADYAFDSGYRNDDWEWVDDTKLTTLYLPKSVKNIGYAAFSGCGGLKNVYYAGSSADAKKINIDSDNTALQNAKWHYNCKFATITKEPATAAYAKKGAKVSVKITATGEGLKYAWYIKNDGKKTYSKSSVTTSTYSTTMSSSSKGRRVYCIVTDKYGNKVQSKTFLLRESVSITKEPATTAYAKKGAKVSVKITASGDGLKYAWYIKNDGKKTYSKSSITSSTYSATMSSSVKGRRVYCIVTDKYGKKVQSKTFLLRESVSITTQPKTVSVKKNATAKVTVKASGDGLTYTWYIKNSGAKKYSKSSIKKSTYSVKMTSKVKNRLVYCVVKDKYGKTVKTTTVKLKMK